MRIWFFWIVAIVCAMPCRSGALASFLGQSESTEERAQQLAEQALDAYQEGRYRDALPLFQQAQELVPDPTLAYNLARTQEKLGRTDEAIKAYQHFLTMENGDPELRKRTQQRLVVLVPPVPPVKPVTPPPPPKAPKVTPEQHARVTPRLVWPGLALAALGLGGIAVGTGLYVGLSNENDRFDTLADEFEKRTARDYAQGLALGSQVAFGVGGALLTSGVIMMAIGARKPARPLARVDVMPLGPGAMVRMLGRF